MKLKTFLFTDLLVAIFVATGLVLGQNALLQSTAGLIEPVPEPPVQAYQKAKILFVGDIMLDRGVLYYSKKSAGENANDFVFEKIKNKLQENDLVIANLEGPVTSNESISIKAKTETPESFYFTFDPSWAKTLYQNNIKLVNLGNNHILNFKSSGLKETKNYLKEQGIAHFGAPASAKTVLVEVNGIKIKAISYNQFSAYEKIEAEIVINEIKKAQLQKLAGKTDFIIVYAHWGAEYVPDPAASIKNLARSFIDEGADLVIGSHPHVIQPIEVYKGKRIYYSLGNFIFDQYFSEETKKGLGVAVKIDKQAQTLEFEEIYFYTQENGQTVILEK